MPLTIIILLSTVIIIAGFKIHALQREVLALGKELEDEKKEFSEVAVYNERQREVKNQNKAKVMALFEAYEKLTNKKVANHLGVSKATAFRYLEELEQEGRVKQNHSFGQFVNYTKTSQLQD